MSADGWNYDEPDLDGGDARKFVTLLLDGMVWVGVRYWNNEKRCWYNGNEPEHARVLAWRDMPEPAKKRWVRGELV